MGSDAVFSHPALDLQRPVIPGMQRRAQSALESGGHLWPRRAPGRNQNRVIVALGELAERQQHEVVGLAKLDFPAGEDVKAPWIECARTRPRKEKSGVDAFMNHGNRFVRGL